MLADLRRKAAETCRRCGRRKTSNRAKTQFLANMRSRDAAHAAERRRPECWNCCGSSGRVDHTPQNYIDQAGRSALILAAHGSRTSLDLSGNGVWAKSG